MTEFININGFSLYGETQTNLTLNKTSIPWLRIEKEPNKLPVAYLTSRIFYWKTEEENSENKYIFFNHLTLIGQASAISVHIYGVSSLDEYP